MARDIDEPTLVLGSTQTAELVDDTALRASGVALARRRGGGGAVYLAPGEQLWVDVWIPRHDPLWAADVSVAAEWVGAWWVGALAAVRQHGFSVHHGRSVAGDLGDLVCFAGRGPGEVFLGQRKLVGLSQWRSREGALFSACAYRRWDPAPLLALVGGGIGASAGASGSERAAAQVRGSAMGLGELDPPVADLDLLRAALLGSLPSFSVTGRART